ncbi:MAG: TolC family protein [Desulfotignum sp.]|nr:TolC family protein [Desulfotignum sp.]
MRTCCLVFIFCLAAAGYPNLYAADSARYTLNDLCRAANDNARTIRIATDEVFIAEQEKKRALSVLVPRATAFGSHTNHKDTSFISPDTTTVGVKLTQSFTLNGKELIAYDVTKKGIDKTLFTLEGIRSDYLLQVALSYFDTLEAKRLLEIAEADVQRLAAHKNAVKEKLRVGSVTRTDLYRAEAALSRAMSDRVMAGSAVIQNKARLVELTGIGEPFVISDEDITPMEEFDPTLAAIQETAMQNRYEIQEAEKNLEISDQTVSYEKGDYWPKLNLETGYRESDTSYGSSGAAGGLAGNIASDAEDTYIQAELVFTLYDGGLRKAQINQAMARKRQAAQALSQTRKEIILESTVAFSDYETARKVLVNLDDELKAAQENHKAVQMQYQYGMADIIDMMDANTLLVQAERSMSNARYAMLQTMYRILHTQGELLAYLLE